MPDWSIVLLAAFGGGLAGAVLQPVVSYVLQRVRSAEEIQKNRERSLRRMLNTYMAMGRQYTGFSVRRKLDRSLKPAEVLTALNEIAQRFVTQPGAVWQPERIKVDSLYEMACEHHAELERLITVLSAKDYDPAEAQKLEDRLEELRRQITGRMDKLNWPEVDD